MYLDHFGLNESPFRITPHTDFFFAGANRGAMLEALLYALLHDEGIVKVTGEVGSGKTMLCRVLMERLPANVETIYLANPSLARDEILFALADELRLDLGSERHTRLIKSLQDALIGRYAGGRRVVALIDEAHAMPAETLEEIRLLSNLEANRHKLLQIVLFGQPELDEHLSRPHMRQLKERITQSFRLGPFGRDEIAAYIDFRMRAAGYKGPSVFSPGAVRLLAAASEGLTRRVNILADKSLLAAFARNTHAVTEREVRRAIDDSEFHQPPSDRGRYAWLAGGVAAGVALGALAAWQLLRASVAPATVAPVTAAPAPATSSPVVQAAPASAVEPPSAGEPARISGPPSPPVDGTTTAAASAAPPPSPARADTAAVGAPSADARRTEAAVASTNGPSASYGTPARADSASPGPPGALSRARFQRTQDWLSNAPGGLYSIQLITVRESEARRLEDFLLKTSKLVPEEHLYVYSVKIDGAQHYRVALGTYPTVAEVRAAIQELPDFLRSRSPYHRSVERMRSQNRQ